MASKPRPIARIARRPKARLGVFVRGLDDTRALLVSAARDVFLEVGPANFSLREVARRVGISAAAVYRHFEGKEALVFAACTQGFEVFARYLVRSLEQATPLERLLAAGDQYRAFGLENPLDYRFIFMSSAEQVNLGYPDRVKTKGTSALPQDTTFRFLIDRVKECIEAGVLADGNAEQIAILIWAHVHGLVSLRLSGHFEMLGDDGAFAAFYSSSVARLLRGLGR